MEIAEVYVEHNFQVNEYVDETLANNMNLFPSRKKRIKRLGHDDNGQTNVM